MIPSRQRRSFIEQNITIHNTLVDFLWKIIANAKNCSCWFIVQESSEEHLYDDKNYLPHPIMELNTDGFEAELSHPRSGDAPMQHTLKERRTDHNFRDLVDLIFRCV
jgi:hypothetical protein